MNISLVNSVAVAVSEFWDYVNGIQYQVLKWGRAFMKEYIEKNDLDSSNWDTKMACLSHLKGKR